MRTYCQRVLHSCVTACRAAVQPDALARHRWLSPLLPRLTHPSAWSTETRALTIGISAGLLWAFLTPILQIPLACIHATLLRGNLLAAALATLITNPITLAPWTYAAHQIGVSLLGNPVGQPIASSPQHWSDIVSSAGAAWAVGSLALGVTFSLLGLFLTPPITAWLRRRSSASKPV